MLFSVLDWLKAGSPAPHYLQILGAIYMLLEYALPRTNLVRARSVIEAAANVIGMLFPSVKKYAGSPEAEVAQ